MTIQKRNYQLLLSMLFSGQVLFLFFSITFSNQLKFFDVQHMITDLGEYYSKVMPVLRGTVAFSHMLLEYPMAAFPIMAFPALLASDMNKYLVPFVLEIVIWNAICFFIVTRWARREQGYRFAAKTAVWYTLWMMIFTPLWGLRIDIPVATLIFASFTWLISRPVLSGLMGVFGGYIKLIPFVTALVAIRQKRSFKVVLVAGGTFVCLLILWWIFARPYVEYFLLYHFQRGLEIGSLYSGIMYGIGKIAHWPMITMHNFSSEELLTPLSQLTLRFIPILQVAAILYPFARLPVGTNERNLRLVIAMVVGYIVFGKVLSPQYILWLIPLYAVLSGRQAVKQQGIFTVVCVATLVLFPLWFNELVKLNPFMFVILNIRNALLLWLYWIVVRPEKLLSYHQAQEK